VNPADTALSFEVIRRHEIDYAECYEDMRRFTSMRGAETPDQIWLVSHPPVFTLGLAADPAHVLLPVDIPVIQTDRGGEVTYHGPGQAVVYLLLDLKRRRAANVLYIREFVQAIEESVLETLKAYNLTGVRRPGAPGIYVAQGRHAGAKIAALGVKVRGNGCTYHGVALNVDMDLEPFSRINPCGYAGLETVDMRALGVRADVDTVCRQLACNLMTRLA